MQFISLRFVALMVILMTAAPTFGEEKAPEVPASKERREYVEKSAKLRVLASRIEETEKEFKELVQQKAQQKDPEAIQGILKQMVDASQRRNKAVEDFNKLKTDLTLRYPNEGKDEARRYETQAKKSVEELEGVAGLDDLLTRTKRIVENKFAAFAEPDVKRKVRSKKTKGPSEEEPDEAPRLRLEK